MFERFTVVTMQKNGGNIMEFMKAAMQLARDDIVDRQELEQH